MIWCLTEQGRKMPIDPDPVEGGNVIKLWIDPDGNKVIRVLGKGETTETPRKRYVSHFATCPDSDQHRRSR